MKIFTLLCIIIIFQSCNKYNENSTFTENEQKFLNWKEDTLIKLNKIYYDTSKYEFQSNSFASKGKNNVMNEEFIIHNSNIDFLYLILEYEYSNIIELNKIENESKYAKTVLSLISEFDTLPKNNFRLEFKWVVPYFPSETGRLNYESQSEINDIKISKFDEKIDYIEYFYLRGRLTSKKVYKSEYYDL